MQRAACSDELRYGRPAAPRRAAERAPTAALPDAARQVLQARAAVVAGRAAASISGERRARRAVSRRGYALHRAWPRCRRRPGRAPRPKQRPASQHSSTAAPPRPAEPSSAPHCPSRCTALHTPTGQGCSTSAIPGGSRHAIPSPSVPPGMALSPSSIASLRVNRGLKRRFVAINASAVSSRAAFETRCSRMLLQGGRRCG